MSKVVTRYFQKCDMCNQEFQLQSVKDELSKTILPGRFIPCDGSGPTPRLITVHLCPACLQEMSHNHRLWVLDTGLMYEIYVDTLTGIQYLRTYSGGVYVMVDAEGRPLIWEGAE